MLSKDWNISTNHFSNLLEKWDTTLLVEDIFQASNTNYIIDSGWYGEDSSGRFITFLIKDLDWDNPVVRIESSNLEETIFNISICEDVYSKIKK